MTQYSWCKRVWKGHSKGLSTVLGTVFLALVIFAVSTNVFIWTLSRNADYTQAVKDENQKDVDRLSENVIASGANYSVSGDDVTVKATLTNGGSVVAQIINLWVFDADPASQRYTNKSLDLNLKPGEVLNLTGLDSLTVTIPGADASHEFISWFVTSRGNTVPLETADDMLSKDELIAELVSQGGVGPMIYDFYEFRYYLYQDNKLQDYPAGIEDFEVPNDEDIAFGVSIANYDVEERDMTITSYTHLWVSSDMASMNQWERFYNVDVAPDGTPSGFTGLTLHYGEKELLVLASDERGGFQKKSLPGSKYPDDTVQGTFLLIYGFFEGDSFAQNVPFVAFFMT